MSKSNHQIEVEKLSKIESELLRLISDSGNEELQNKFLEWQRQRAICNVSLVTELEHSNNIVLHHYSRVKPEIKVWNTLTDKDPLLAIKILNESIKKNKRPT